MIREYEITKNKKFIMIYDYMFFLSFSPLKSEGRMVQLREDGTEISGSTVTWGHIELAKDKRSSFFYEAKIFAAEESAQLISDKLLTEARSLC